MYQQPQQQQQGYYPPQDQGQMGQPQPYMGSPQPYQGQSNVGAQQPYMGQPQMGQPQPYMGQPQYQQQPQPYMGQNQIPVGQPMYNTPTVGNPMIEVVVADPMAPRVPTMRVSQSVLCSNCQRVVMTNVRYEAGTGAFVVGAVVFLCGFWLCCWIPCVLEDCQDAHHFCSSCQQQLGVKKYLCD